MEEIYFDNGATTKPYEECIQEVSNIMRFFYGNPSSIHKIGFEASNKLKEYREFFAKSINANSNEIIFTSGGSEGNNQVIRSVCNNGGHVITSKIEHPSIIKTIKSIENIEHSTVNVYENGIIDINNLIEKLKMDTLLVVITFVNAEIGTIQEIEKIVSVIREKSKRAKILVDAVQGYGKFIIDVKKMNIDFLTTSAHKLHGPRGIGFLYVKNEKAIKPLITGGGQERGLRSGTENLSSIGGFKIAAEKMLNNMDKNYKNVNEIKNIFIEKLLENFDVRINSKMEKEFSPYVLNVSFKKINGEVLLRMLSDKKIYVSTGSACSSKKGQSSIIEVIGIQKEYAKGTIRFSFNELNKREEVEYTIESLIEAIGFLT